MTQPYQTIMGSSWNSASIKAPWTSQAAVALLHDPHSSHHMKFPISSSTVCLREYLVEVSTTLEIYSLFHPAHRQKSLYLTEFKNPITEKSHAELHGLHSKHMVNND